MSDGEGGDGELKPAGVDEEEDKRCMSVREAVKFAKANNLLGLVLDATLIVRLSYTFAFSPGHQADFFSDLSCVVFFLD